MIDPATQAELKRAIADCIGMGRAILDTRPDEIAPLKAELRLGAMMAWLGIDSHTAGVL